MTDDSQGARRRVGSLVRTPALQLAALLALSEAIYLALLRFDAVNGVGPVLRFLVLMAALFALYAAAYVVVGRVGGQSHSALAVVATGAVLFRLTLLPAGLPHDAGWRERLDDLRADLRGERVAYERFLLFDDDVWRYLWDGHVWAHGVNPYRCAPGNPALDELADEDNAELTDGRAVWSDIRENIVYPETRTVYPPLAQAVFRVSHRLAPGSVLVLKALLVGFDLLGVLFIALALRRLGRPATDVLLYAWNPLVIKVFAASGHVDAVLVATLAATAYFVLRGWRAAAAGAFGLAVLAKLAPLVLLPFVVRRAGWRRATLILGVVVAGDLPFLGAGPGIFAGLATLARQWQFNAGPLALVAWAAGHFTAQAGLAARALTGLAVLAWLLWLARRDDGDPGTFARLGAAALGALIVVGPAVMPWYVTWVLPLALLAGQWVWFYFSGLVCLAFFVMISGVEDFRALGVEYGLLAVLLGLEFYRRKVAAAGGVSPSDVGTAGRAG
jgi:hypothetical protein